MDLLHRVTSFLQTRAGERGIRARLVRLDDRSLADMGLERAAIGRLARPGERPPALGETAALTRQALGLRAV